MNSMKTYTVIFNTKNASFGNNYTAYNAIHACAKAVLQFAYLGARFNNIAKVEARD